MNLLKYFIIWRCIRSLRGEKLAKKDGFVNERLCSTLRYKHSEIQKLAKSFMQALLQTPFTSFVPTDINRWQKNR